jgi:hypothetical protein
MSGVSDTDDADRPSDLPELLATDHARILRILDEDPDLETMQREIEPHLVSEDQLLYREFRTSFADADPLVDDMLDLDRRIELTLVEEWATPADIKALFEEHVRRQEDVAFPKLRTGVSEDRLVLLGGALMEVMRTAPTRPHPHSPDEGWREQLADGYNAIVDHLFHRH